MAERTSSKKDAGLVQASGWFSVSPSKTTFNNVNLQIGATRSLATLYSNGAGNEEKAQPSGNEFVLSLVKEDGQTMLITIKGEAADQFLETALQAAELMMPDRVSVAGKD